MRSTRRSTIATRRDLSSTIFFFLLACLLTLLATPLVARAAPSVEADEADEYEVTARVARVSLISGDVNLKRSGNNDWERVRLNFPLVEGDTISTNGESRAEIQIDSKNFVRLGANSILKIVTLRDEGVALSVVEGTATIRLAKFDRDHEYFELDAPKTTMAAEKKGLYRVDVSREGRVRLTARDGGRARIYSETSGFALRDGRAAELILEGADAGDWEFVAANSDSWDSWVGDRERYLAERLRYDVQYYDKYTWGAEDLDAYGNWTYANEYGWIWRPHRSSISSYADWAPYRYGDWVWVAPYGWTWVGNEPWGWAPYHYGRWVYYNGYWAWCPRSHYYRNRGWWRPSLVAFVFSGNNYCWYPLNYHQRDPRSRHYPRYDRNSDRLRPMRGNDLASLRRVNPAQLRAVTSLAARDIGALGARGRPADAALARRVVDSDLLRPDLPARPARAAGDRASGGDRTGSVAAARPARGAPGLDSPQRSERQTGAAPRNPGVALDEELRRSRVLNGREARPVGGDSPVPTGGVGAIEARPTGAVERPARPVGEGDRRVDPTRVPVRIPANNEATPVDRPARTERTERPRETDQVDRSDRPVRSERPARTEPREEPGRVEQRNDPPVRYEPPKRAEPPPRSDPPPVRYEPPPRSEPPPRNDPPPQRHEPPSRSDPPPQRHEPPPRSDPPPRNDPPPQRSDPPPRSEPPPQRSEPARPNTERPSRRGDPR